MQTKNSSPFLFLILCWTSILRTAKEAVFFSALVLTLHFDFDPRTVYISSGMCVCVCECALTITRSPGKRPALVLSEASFFIRKYLLWESQRNAQTCGRAHASVMTLWIFYSYLIYFGVWFSDLYHALSLSTLIQTYACMYAWRAANFCWLTQHDNITNIAKCWIKFTEKCKRKRGKWRIKRVQTNWVIKKFAVWPLKFEFAHSKRKTKFVPKRKELAEKSSKLHLYIIKQFMVGIRMAVLSSRHPYSHTLNHTERETERKTIKKK